MSDKAIHPDAERIKAAILEQIVMELTAIEAGFYQEIGAATADFDRGAAERRAAGCSLTVLTRELRSIDVPSRPLEILRNALLKIDEGGKPPAIFAKARAPSRPRDPTSLLVLKGTVVATVEYLAEIEPSISRSQAQGWAAGVLKASGRKALTRTAQRTVREWCERFGGPHGEAGRAREAYIAVLLRYRSNPRGLNFNRTGLADTIKQVAVTLPENSPS